MENWQLISSEINLQLSRVKSSAPGDSKVMLLELTRAVDHVFTVSSFIVPRDSDNPECQKWHDLFNVQSTGFYGSVELFIRDEVNRAGLPFPPTSVEIQNWIHSCLNICGHIGFASRFLELMKTGVVKCARTELNKFLIKIPLNNVGYEAADLADIEWIKKLRVEKSLPVKGRNISRIISENVRVWRNHFIAYNSTKQLDSFYEKRGAEYSGWLDGGEEFTDDTIFNGILFSEYKAVIVLTIGLTLKHRDCCFSLVRSHKDVNLWNILTLPELKNDLVGSIAAYRKLDHAKVSAIVDDLTLTPENVDIFKNNAGGPPPPFIKIAEGHILRSVMGVLSNPYFFLLKILKEKYPTEYSKGVNKREDVFRRDLYKLFPSPTLLKCNSPLMLTINGFDKTDVDAVIFDKTDSSVAVIQLKWMDTFGKSMKERNSKAANFTERSEKWINSVQGWLLTEGMGALEQKLKDLIPKRFRISKVHIIVIGRHYSYFSGRLKDGDALWVSWSRLLRLKEEHSSAFSNLAVLTEKIIANSAIKIEIPEKDEIINVGEYEVTISSLKSDPN